MLILKILSTIVIFVIALIKDVFDEFLKKRKSIKVIFLILMIITLIVSISSIVSDDMKKIKAEEDNVKYKSQIDSLVTLSSSMNNNMGINCCLSSFNAFTKKIKKEIDKCSRYVDSLEPRL